MPRSKSQVDASAKALRFRRGQLAKLLLAIGLAGCGGGADADESSTLLGSTSALVEPAAAPEPAAPRRDAGGPSVDAGGPLLDAGVPKPDASAPPLSDTAAHWQFDDCSPATTTLLDSSPSAAHAVRSASVTCGEGVSGAGLVFDARSDTVRASARPAFDVSNGLTVSAFVHPQTTTQGTLVTKQTRDGAVYELALDRGRAVFSVNLRDGSRTRRVSSSAPIVNQRWTHLAGVFDGSFVRLFRDGQQVGQVAATGVLVDGSADIELGNNGQQRALHGRLDEVHVFNRALADFELIDHSCFRREPTVTVSPENPAAVDPEVTVQYEVVMRNNDVGACPPAFPFLSISETPAGISASADNPFPEVPMGATFHFGVTVTGSAEATPGLHELPFAIFSDTLVEGSLRFTLNAATGCFVRTARELLIRDLSVVEDPIRTVSGGSPDDPRSGVWTFERLMQDMAPAPEQAPAMVEQLLRTWLSDQTVNTFTVAPRDRLSSLVLDGWPRVNGALDLSRAPVRLLAIVNRLDVRNLQKGHAGEGRFVFGVLDRDGEQLPFTLIFEYRLPATTESDVLAWAQRWHALGQLPFPSEQYNAALQQVTSLFAGRGAEPGRVNGSALGQLRTNENALEIIWELREFKLSAATGMLVPSPVELTPDDAFIAGSSVLADYVNEHEASILVERHEVPASFRGQSFLGGASRNNLRAWTAPGIRNPEARHRFSLNTCNGCHSSAETGTAFLHVFPRDPNQVAPLSGFMTGMFVRDPQTGVPRIFNDLGRRNADLKAVVCGGVASTQTTPLPAISPLSPARPPRPPTRSEFLARGIGRAH